MRNPYEPNKKQLQILAATLELNNTKRFKQNIYIFFLRKHDISFYSLVNTTRDWYLFEVITLCDIFPIRTIIIIINKKEEKNKEKQKLFLNKFNAKDRITMQSIM